MLHFLLMTHTKYSKHVENSGKDGYPFQKCRGSLSKISSPRASCGKSTGQSCNGFIIATSGVSYNKDRMREIKTEAISITYGAPGKRQHIFTYAAGYMESFSKPSTCPCNGGTSPPAYVGSDYYCESGNTGQDWESSRLYHEDPLWDGQQCGGREGTCCNPPNLGWFCKKFSTSVTGDIEFRLCADESLANENLALHGVC
ncbi:hypothetical protein EMCRGX_G007135 [Ephydatia muelleri]